MDFLSYDTVPHLEGVELISVGMEWPASTGPYTCTFEQIADIIIAANDDPLVRDPRIKLGHVSEVNGVMRVVNPFQALGDAAPAFGRIVNLRSDNGGAVLLGDFMEVPEWLAEAMPSAFPSRSAEPWLDAETPGGKRYAAVLTAVSLLGTFLPAIGDLEDLQRLMEGGPDAVAATRQEASVPELSVSVGSIRDRFNFEWATDPDSVEGLDTFWWWARDVRVDPNEIIADDDEGGLYRIPFETDGEDEVTFGEPEEVREVYVPVNASGGQAFGRTTPVRAGQTVLASNLNRPRKRPTTAASPRPANDDPEEGRMSIDIGALRERLGLSDEQLPDDATEEQINAALTAEHAPGSEEPDSPPVEGDPDSPPEGDPPNVEEEEPAAASAVSVDAETWERTREQAAAGAQVATEQRTERRDTYLSEAVEVGKFAPSRLEHYTSLYDADEEGTRSLIDGLAEGLVPVDERGSAASESDQATHDRIMAGAFGITSKEDR